MSQLTTNTALDLHSRVMSPDSIKMTGLSKLVHDKKDFIPHISAESDGGGAGRPLPLADNF